MTVRPEPIQLAERLSVVVLEDPARRSELAEDVRRGLRRVPKDLPPKYFYDARGSRLFDAICDTPEYYPTRTEQALLERVAADIVGAAGPEVLVELGSGAARKTRVLLDALVAAADRPLYVPVDISRAMLEASARALLDDYPTLEVCGVVADYDRPLRLPGGGRRLIAFLGGTIGNFTQPEAVRFLSGVAAGMGAGDTLVLGLDLVKSPGVLHAAYNDAAGLTAEFNRNVLHVINRALGADFDPAAFEHIARYLPEQQQVEMRLRSARGQRVHIPALDMSVAFGAGEELRTEISRKFTRGGAHDMIAAAGLTPAGWHPAAGDSFALVCARRPS